MRRADVIIVDNRNGALTEGGDLVQAIASGAIARESILADLADLARGAHPGRTDDAQITVFKSVGFALEDLAAAEAILDASQRYEEPAVCRASYSSISATSSSKRRPAGVSGSVAI